MHHTYNTTTVPACTSCNTAVLNQLEKRINNLLAKHNLPNSFFSEEEITDIIRWLEIIEYKLQVFSLTTKFRVSKKGGPIAFLADYPLSVLDPNIDYSPARAVTALRQAVKRITIKSKKTQINSLVMFKTTNQGFTFFHKNNDYIFLELPHKKIAIFYFFQRAFPDVIEARDQAIKIIKAHC